MPDPGYTLLARDLQRIRAAVVAVEHGLRNLGAKYRSIIHPSELFVPRVVKVSAVPAEGGGEYTGQIMDDPTFLGDTPLELKFIFLEETVGGETLLEVDDPVVVFRFAKTVLTQEGFDPDPEEDGNPRWVAVGPFRRCPSLSGSGAGDEVLFPGQTGCFTIDSTSDQGVRISTEGGVYVEWTPPAGWECLAATYLLPDPLTSGDATCNPETFWTGFEMSVADAKDCGEVLEKGQGDCQIILRAYCDRSTDQWAAWTDLPCNVATPQPEQQFTPDPSGLGCSIFLDVVINDSIVETINVAPGFVADPLDATFVGRHGTFHLTE